MTVRTCIPLFDTHIAKIPVPSSSVFPLGVERGWLTAQDVFFSIIIVDVSAKGVVKPKGLKQEMSARHQGFL